GGGPSAGVHERYRIQRDPSSPDKGLRHGGDHSEKGPVARRERAKKSPGLLTPKALAGHAGPAAGHSLRSSRPLEVSRVHACSLAHSDAWDRGERRRLRSSECRSTASIGCERPAEPLPASPQALDEL